MTEIELFKNPEFGEIRAFVADEEPWFSGVDVASALGYLQPNKAITDHVDEFDRKSLNYKACSVLEQALWVNPNDFSDKWVINESGVYALIFGSTLPKAKEFKRWVTKEVLPSIRKTGSYSLANTVLTSEDPLERAKAFVAVMEAERQKQLVLTTRIAEMQPKATYCDVVLSCPDVVATTLIAKDYGKSAKWMNHYLSDKKIQFKQGGVWFPYQKYAELGLTKTKTLVSDGRAFPHTYWTQKGRLFIYDLLKADGILPMIER